MARKPPGRKAAALGAELRAIRKRLNRSMLDVAQQLGWSESMLSRLETGNRNIEAEEVSALLAVYGIVGTEREQLIMMARTPEEPSWLDRGLSGIPPESVRLATYEADATAITDWSLKLVPGMLQTMEYTRAFMLADGVAESVIGSRLMARQRRQEKLGQLRYVAYLDEDVIGRPIGGQRVMRGQLQRLIELAEDQTATIRIVPGNADAHSGLLVPFMLLESAHEAPIVHVELPRSGVFLTGAQDTAVYVDIVRRLDSLSLDVEESLRLLRTAAGAMGSDT